MRRRTKDTKEHTAHVWTRFFISALLGMFILLRGSFVAPSWLLRILRLPSYPSLCVPQGHQRIDGGGVACGNVGRDRRDREEARRGDPIRERVRGRDAAEQGTQRPP